MNHQENNNQNQYQNYNNENRNQNGYNNYSNNTYGNNDNHMKKLYRSRLNRMLCGVCGGVANYFGCDATIVRLLYVFLAFCSCGTALIAYLVMAIVVPETPFNE